MALIIDRGGRAVGIGAPPSRGSRRRELALADASLMFLEMGLAVVDVVVVVVLAWVGRVASAAGGMYALYALNVFESVLLCGVN